MSEVIVTPEQMYQLLLCIDSKVSALTATMDTLDERVADHEARLRTIEQKEDLARRVAEIEGSLREIQRRVWALPSAATVIAAAAIILTLVRTY